MSGRRTRRVSDFRGQPISEVSAQSNIQSALRYTVAVSDRFRFRDDRLPPPPAPILSAAHVLPVRLKPIILY